MVNWVVDVLRPTGQYAIVNGIAAEELEAKPKSQKKRVQDLDVKKSYITRVGDE